MLSYTDLKSGVIIMFNNEPHEVLESNFSRMQQRKAVVQSKLKNLISGKVIEKTWQASNEIEEADLIKSEAIFLYNHRGQFWFHQKDNPKNRFYLSDGQVAEANFLKPQTSVAVYFLDNKPIKVVLPIKMDFQVIEAPPSIRGNTAQGGNKIVIIESGARISAPLFIEQGDIIRINTQTGEYTERVKKKSA